MRTIQRMLIGIICGVWAMSAQAQQATPAAGGESRPMTREERIRANQERIKKLIEESRQKQQQAQQGSPAPGAATPIPGQPGGGPALPGGQARPPSTLPGQQPLPTGPVQQARMTPPVQGQQKQAAAAPQGARSESRTILLFNPLDSAVSVGDRFKTDVVADTKQGQIDEFSVLITYPTKYLNPLGLDSKKIEPDVATGIDYEFDPEEGTIYLRADLKKARSFSQQPLFTLIWEAIEPTEGAVINYAFSEEKTSGLYLDDSNLLGTMPGSEDGVINTTVLVRSPTRKPTVTAVGKKDLLISTEPIDTPRDHEPMRLELVSSKAAVKAGETFEVSIKLLNPDGGPIDRLSAFIKFDPREVEAVDYDSGNVVKRGTNLNDGKSRDEFPFDYYKVNEIDNESGIALYEVSATGTKVRGAGTVATVRFKALQETPRSDIILIQNIEGVQPTTGVAFRYKSQLAGAGEENQPAALAAASVAIRGALTTARAEKASQ